MMTMTMKNGRPAVRVEEQSPTVYLDHWAMMDLVSSVETRDAFVSWIDSEQGTLAISLLNLIEFSSVGDMNIARADDLLDLVFPRIMFIDHDFLQVIKREKELSRHGGEGGPHFDPGAIEILAMLRPAGLEPIGVKGLIPLMKTEQMMTSKDNLADTIVGEVEKIRRTISVDADKARNARRPAVVPKHIPRVTSALERELLQRLAFDNKGLFTRRDAIDLCHTVVPVSYCDYVVLDKRWASLADESIRRLQRAGETFRSAHVVSGRRHGIEGAIADIKTDWPSRRASK